MRASAVGIGSVHDSQHEDAMANIVEFFGAE